MLYKYPFLTEAKEYAAKYDLRELVYSPIFSSVREMGYHRVIFSIQNRKIQLPGDEESLLLSYPIARILVSGIKDQWLIHRYILYEARLARRYLNKDLELGGAEIIWDILGYLDIKVEERAPNLYVMNFVDYLRFQPGKDRYWKLVNRLLDKGDVIIERRDMVRIIEEGIRKKLKEELPINVPAEILDKLKPYMDRISAELKYRKDVVKPKKIGGYPPCISRIMSELERNENIEHMGRFVLVTYLHSTGLSNEEISKKFSNAPDFEMEKSRYQIEFITGKEYKMPSCATMRTYGLCKGADEICESISHPLEYRYGHKKGDRDRKSANK